LRGTASTGFRAPTLAEQYYSATNVSPTTTSVQLPANSAAAKLAGADELKPEKSRNLSLGIVSTPAKSLRLTADAYLVDIRDRIVLASGLRGASPVAAITSRGIVIQTAPGSASVAYFANGIDTRTRGLDLTGQYTSDFDGWGLVKWSLAANFLNTRISKAKTAASTVQLSTGNVLFNPNVRSGLTDASPKSKLIASADWTLGQWSLGLRVTRYGKASLVSPTGSTGAAPYYRSTVNPAWIADVEAAWEPTQKWRFSAGVNNLFNRYPQRVAPQTITPTGAGLLPGFSPYGYNGAYYNLGTSYRF
ncbi:MAG: TonB-dependent receptor, partial [Aquabacterium sp.]